MSPELLTRTLLANSGTLYTATSIRSPAPNVTMVDFSGLSFEVSPVFSAFAFPPEALMASCEIGCGGGRFVGAAFCPSAGLFCAPSADCCADNPATVKNARTNESVQPRQMSPVPDFIDDP